MSIQENVMLVRWTISSWGATKRDNENTEKICRANHMTAEAFLRNVATACGGQQERRHKHGVLGAAVHAIHHALGHSH